MELLLHDKKITIKSKIFLFITSLCVIFTFWTIITSINLIKPIFLPSPYTATVAIITLVKDFGLLNDIAISVYRIFAGFLLACIISFPLGIILGINQKIRVVFEPIIAFIRYIPPSALVPLFILWFGIGDFSKIIFIFASVTPYLTLLIFDSILNINLNTILAGYTLGITKYQIIKHIIIPQALPRIWDAMRFMFGAAWTFVVLIEIIASTSGLGYLIITSQRYLQTPNVISGIIIIGTIGLLTDQLFAWSYKKMFPWEVKSIYA